MDPFQALTITCGVVQFVDFGVKIIATARELYQSATGTSDRHAELQEKAERLTSIIATFSGAGSSGNIKVEAALRKIVDECNDVGIQMRTILDCLKLDPPTSPIPTRKVVSRVFRSAVKSSKTLVKASVITELTERMAGLREEVHSHILYMLNERASKTYQALVDLTQQNARIGTELSDEITKVKDQIISRLHSCPGAGSPAANSHTMESLMSCLSHNALDVDLKTKILSSLHFGEIQDRHDHIKTAEDDTFEWVSNPTIAQSSRKTAHFTEWLKSQKSGDNIFWISGKPGSGKSTLMKYLWENDTVAKCLDEWARPKRVIKCQFYFWISGGSRMLNSQSGFLRALAFGILKSNPAVIAHACPRRWARYSSDKEFFDPWNIEELLETIERATSWKENNTKFCFFIDGLDEYDGEPNEIICLLRKLPMSLDVKFCFSSRKWNAFRNEYGEDTRDPTRRLYLEELNGADIETFVSHKLGKEPLFKRYTDESQRASQYLVRTVVTKSEGVFLWVDLVVRSLIRGLQNLDSLETLQERLNKMPGDLDAYFGRMLGNVEGVYRRDAAKIYQVMLRTTKQPYLMMFAFLSETNPNFGVLAKIEPASEMEVERLRRTLRAQINARCTDLLDIIKTSGTKAYFQEAYFQLKVAFLHRTVREYIESTKTKKRLEEWLSDNRSRQFDPYQYISQAIVAQIKRAPKKKQFLSTGGGPITELAEQFSSLKNVLSWRSQGLHSDLIRELIRALSEQDCDGLIKESLEICRPDYNWEAIPRPSSSVNIPTLLLNGMATCTH